MIDDPLPTPSGIDAEPAQSEEDPSDERPSGGRASDGEPDAERTARESGTDRDRSTDPPPDSEAGEGLGDRESETAAGDDDSDESEPLEYRLERLRLWRTVVTLAVVVGRLIRSL
ncbi:hypothetical protein DM2_2794 [Halorubrum sp. DM2]|uniref:hypothetical protein n=1 Tax=unclassified Halorubrum TaxID=2642239 RepID=UPI00064FC998|nr:MULTISPECIES: hypothetical protein [unclassified Halorubrum]VTT86756.1 hypothetical protein DM2_2794 [Halorubrum sp. DM2]